MDESVEEVNLPPAKKAKLSEDATADNISVVSGSSDDAQIMEELEGCQKDIDDITSKAYEEILQIELKYLKLCRAHYEKRGALIADIELFWLTAMLHHPQLSKLLEEEDQDLLQYCTQIDIKENTDLTTGFAVKFQFRQNPFFNNDCLIKEYFLQVKAGEPLSKSTVIDWKPNMRIRPIDGSTSFCSWFSKASNAVTDSILKWIKNELWANPLEYYSLLEDITENGIYSSSSDDDDDMLVEDNADDSVVIVGDDSDDDDDCYEVDGEDSEAENEDVCGFTPSAGVEENIESIEVTDDDDDEDDDDDDDVQVLDSDPEDSQVTSTKAKTIQPKKRKESDSIDMIVAAAVENLDTEETKKETDVEASTSDNVNNAQTNASKSESVVKETKGDNVENNDTEKGNTGNNDDDGDGDKKGGKGDKNSSKGQGSDEGTEKGAQEGGKGPGLGKGKEKGAQEDGEGTGLDKGTEKGVD